jgi:phage terminase small subunit
MSLPQMSPRQAEFVRAITEGLSVGEAERRAGYSERSGWAALRNPLVARAIHEAIQTELVSVAAPAAFHVAKTIMMDPAASPRVRADIAFKFMDRAGHIAPTSKQKAPDKALSEMSQAELLAFIERNQAEIDKAEAELAGQAIDVSPQHAAPGEAKPLNFLD